MWTLLAPLCEVCSLLYALLSEATRSTYEADLSDYLEFSLERSQQLLPRHSRNHNDAAPFVQQRSSYSPHGIVSLP